jgi:hypothetical protein
MTTLPDDPSSERQRLDDLERRFLALAGPWDLPERQALWPALAALKGVLNQDDSALCWLNAFWTNDSPPVEWTEIWAQTELRKPPDQITGEDLSKLLFGSAPSQERMRALTAYLLWAGERRPLPSILEPQLDAVRSVLEQEENRLPFRAVWLAWWSLSRALPQGSAMLQVAGERLLQRLQSDGLDPQLELPDFARSRDARLGELGPWFLHLHELAQQWLAPRVPFRGTEGQTSVYASLMFAFGLAHLGNTVECLKLRQQATQALKGRDEVHDFLLNAFCYRVDEALANRPHSGALPTEQLETIEVMSKGERYVVERLRECSRILEPDHRINPYRYFPSSMRELDRSLAELTDMLDKNRVVSRVHDLLRGTAEGAKGSADRARILRAGLALAPLIGEDFALDLLGRLAPIYDALPEATDQKSLFERASLLEKGLYTAAHLHHREQSEQLVLRFQQLLESQTRTRAVQAVHLLVDSCFRGLRKLGMRDEIDRLGQQMVDLILRGEELPATELKNMSGWPTALRILLHVAGGWLYLGRNGQAEQVLNAARTLLFSRDLHNVSKEQLDLAVAYAQTVGQAPIEIAQRRLEELFTDLEGVRDTFTTNSHYNISKLCLIDSVVLATVDLADQQLQGWLDDNEVLIRRRIHRDLARFSADESS